MEVKGKVIQILEEQTGEGRNGTWRKNRFVIETLSDYPKKVCIDVWGDKFDQMNVKVNEIITAFIDVESREWQGKWFTDVKAWKVDRQDAVPSDQGSSNPQQNQPSAPMMDSSSIPAGKEPDYSEDYEDDLPF